MRTVAAHLRRLRCDRRGSLTLEFLLIFGAWAIAALFLINVCLVFGNEVTMQNQLDRAALQASAQGCLDTQVTSHFAAMHDLLKDGVALDARRQVPGRPGHTFDRTAVVSADGQVVAWTNDTNATCSPDTNGGRDIVPPGDWIWLHLRYTQHFFGFGSITIERSSLVISNSLQANSG